jgi:thiamine biosynthesis lipoprotein
MLLSVFVFALTAAPQEPKPQSFERTMMSTRVAVGIADRVSPQQASAAAEAVFAVFAEIEQDLNEWKPESALSKVNAGAGGPGVEAPSELCEVIALSLEGARHTKGLFDPTWAALRGLWKFDPDSKVPAEAEMKAACKRIGYGRVSLSDTADGGAGCTVKLADKGMALGLGGVVKGWGVDRSVQLLRAKGLKDFYVQAGGDLYLSGKNGGRPWRAGIRDPRGPLEKTFANVEVQDRSFSTSGDYEHFFEADGKRYHHIIDPRTCWPAPKSRSATVMARTAVAAEFLSKAIFIEGGDAGIAMAEAAGAEAVIVDADNKVHVSKGLNGKIKVWGPAPDPKPQ